MATEFYNVTCEKVEGTAVELLVKVTCAVNIPYRDPPNDLGWALRALCELGGPLSEQIAFGDQLNDAWVRAHAKEYISEVVVLEHHNYGALADARAYDKMVENEGTGSDKLAVARCKVVVTDPKWLSRLNVGSDVELDGLVTGEERSAAETRGARRGAARASLAREEPSWTNWISSRTP